MKVLVTGGCGFLGGYVVHELLRNGHDVVVGDARVSTANLEIAGDGEIPDVPLLDLDIRDLSAVESTIRDHDIEAVAHLAYLLLAPVRENPHLAVEVNCLGTANVFEAAHRAGLDRVAWTSSGGLMNGYVGTDVEVNDDTPPRPSDTYSHCKLLNEAIAQQFYETHGLNTVALRPVYINGLGLPSSAMGSGILLESVIKPAFGKAGIVPFANDVIPFLDIQELATAVRIALEHELADGAHVYNLRPSPALMLDVMEHIRTLIPDADLEPGEGSFWGTGRPFTDAYGQRMEAELGYQSSRPAVEQFELMVQRVLEHKDLFAKHYEL